MLSIIISTYKPHLLKALEQNIAETIGETQYEIIAINNPGLMGICKAYNQGAEQAQFDNLLFVHEDVKFHSKNWGKTLVKYYNLSDLGVFGLAGNTRKFRLPYGFYSGIRSDGYVFLFHSSHKKPILKHDQFPLQTKVIDGVFIGIKKEIWQEIPFNESLQGFHFYDIDISLRTSVKYKNYLVTDLDFEHFSTGNFGDQWIKACISFNKNNSYNFDPITPQERRDVRNFWYERLLDEKINLKNRIQYAIAMGNNKDTLKNCANFLLNFK